MDGNLTVLETVDRVAVGDVRNKIRDILGAFLFRGEDVEKKGEGTLGWGEIPACYGEDVAAAF